MAQPVAASDVAVQVRGSVTAADVAYARRKIASLSERAPTPVLFAKVHVVLHADPARERPASVKAELDLNGRIVRAHAVGTTVPEAADLLEARLHERMERAAHYQASVHLRHRGSGHWRHGDEESSRGTFFDRPIDEREIVRRKTFAVDALTPDKAADELEQLDHDFYLFTNAQTGEDNVVQRVGGGRYALLAPSMGDVNAALPDAFNVSAVYPMTLTTEEAVEQLDAGSQPFVFFLDSATRRGRVMYRRYDGHYGLITASDEEA